MLVRLRNMGATNFTGITNVTINFKIEKTRKIDGEIKVMKIINRTLVDTEVNKLNNSYVDFRNLSDGSYEIILNAT